jgi:TolB-like protein/DNA-binding winged helix-turn-helix (wHTH) protein
VDLRAGEVRKHGIRIRLQDQPFRVLQILLEHAGEVVSREELQKRIWPSDTFVDFDRGLNNAVLRLREALGDSADAPRYVETLAKRGYRFIAMVERNGKETIRAKPGIEPPIVATQVVATRGYRYTRTVFAVLATAAAALFAVMFFGDSLRNRVLGNAAATSIHSIAVLPLQNLSGDPDQEYFADGMTEELITELSRLSGLKVISRTSVMRYKKSDKPLPQIARELKVDAIVEGSVLRSADRVRITTQLIQARTDANVWAETYDRNLQDTLAVQEAVAMAIAGKIQATVMPSAVKQTGARRRPVNLQAHEAYLRGLYEEVLAGSLSNHLGREAESEEHHRRAVNYFQEAIREDPKYALAYVMLAGNARTPEEAEMNARKALDADETLPEAHIVLGAIKLVRDRNWHEAETEFLRAIELNPDNVDAHLAYGFLLDTAGRLEEGAREYQQAQALDPARDYLQTVLYARREFDQLIQLERAGLATIPEESTSDAALAHKALMVAYARTGRHKESIEEFRAGLASMGYTDLAEDLRRGYVRGGYEAALREWLRGLKKYPEFPFPSLETYAYTELKDFDQAFARLPMTYDPGDWQEPYSPGFRGGGVIFMPTLVTLRAEPMWDPLHSDPRFEALARQIGFP